jgi:threonyl-tRNA synthetase
MTPHIGDVKLYKTSGHYEKYGKDSFQPISTPVEGEAIFAETDELPAPLRDL